MRVARLSLTCAAVVAPLVAAGVTAGTATSAAARPASAPVVAVYTGYGDCPVAAAQGCDGSTITNPVFPHPWLGGAGVHWVGDTTLVNPKDVGDVDESAIRIDNLGTSPFTVDQVTVSNCGGTNGVFDPWFGYPWGPYPLYLPRRVMPGAILVLSGTSGSAFDGSDQCGADPVVTVTIGGTAQTYADDVANGGTGAIPGVSGPDESTPWTKVGGPSVPIVVYPQGTLHAGKVGRAYTAQLVAQQSNGAPTFTAGQGVPPGLTLSATGALTGTPTQAGTFTFGVSVSDTAANPDSGQATESVTIDPVS